MNYQERSVPVEAMILPKTHELLQEMQRGLGISLGEAIDKLALHIKAQNSDQAILLILEDISITISELSLDQIENTFDELASTLVALLPLDSMENVLRKALEKQAKIVKGLMDLSDETKVEIKDLLEKIKKTEK